MKKKIFSLITASAIAVSCFTVNVQAQNKERVTFGIDLNDYQEEQMLKEFGVSKDKVSIDRITNDDIIRQLGLDPNDKSNYQGGCYSSSYVKLTDKGGINVQANNLTEVTGLMLSNALVTSGVTSAEVKASSPFPVTGTSALSGILKGFEQAKGEELSLKNKKVAQKEIETTSKLADEIGADEAAAVINDIKTEVIKKSPKNDTEVNEIVDNLTEDYKVNLTNNQKDNIKSLMNEINNLDIDYSKVKNTLNNLGDQLSNALKNAGKELSESGFFQKLLDGISDFFKSIGEWFKSLGNKEAIDNLDNKNSNNPATTNNSNLNSDNNEENKTTDNKSDEKLNSEKNNSNSEDDNKIKEDDNKIKEDVNKEKEQSISNTNTESEVNTTNTESQPSSTSQRN